MPLSLEDLTGGAPAAPAAPAPAPTAEDPVLKAALGVTGGDKALAEKAIASTGSAKPGTFSPPLEPKDSAKHPIPDAVLQIPAFRALLNGEPPAVSAKDGEQDPDIAAVQGNVQPLLYNGFGFYRNLANTGTYLYNGRFMDGNALKIADEQGKLDQIVPAFSELKSAFTQGLAEGEAAPVADASIAAPAPVASPAPAQMPKSLTTARLKNVAIGSPSSGPVPGQGRILNNVLKSAV